MANHPSTAPLGYSLLRCRLGRVTSRTIRRFDRYFDWRIACPTLPIAPLRFHRTGGKQGPGVCQKRPFVKASQTIPILRRTLLGRWRIEVRAGLALSVRPLPPTKHPS